MGKGRNVEGDGLGYEVLENERWGVLVGEEGCVVVCEGGY